MTTATMITALVTPFDTKDQLDLTTLDHLVEHLMVQGGDGFLFGGTTGEGPNLTPDEKMQLYHHAAARFGGQTFVVANTGSNNTRQTIQDTRAVSAIDGIDACLVVVPYYNKPDQAGMIAHFTAVADAASKPIIIYNIPGRTGVTMAVETVLTLAKHPNILGIKQCSDLESLRAIIAQAPADFHVWTGEDAQLAPAHTLGAAGVISVASHLFLPAMRQLINALDHGDMTQAAAVQYQLLPQMAALFHWPSPAPVKAALKAIGFTVGAPRLPILPLTSSQKATLATQLGVTSLAALQEVAS